ncbi:hypothetical protein L6452_21816 [Arctium lappa]|uniref:Uncharacterized protein n=1 Tax=Arctium lappa TaxID=4217 RepID=A0ACB9AYR3_ARCLA|nr:hypothetical protein L6452_21816 [Arctium lappa]
MPRKPTRRGHLRKPQPAFSRLARSMALVTSARKVKQQNENSPVHRKVPPNSTGRNFRSNSCLNGSSKEKHVTTEAKREEESHSSSEDEDSSSEDDFEGVVQADFAFFDPKPDDFHGVKVLMQTYLDNKVWDLSGLVDLILQQTTVGTVIKIEEDEDNGVYGFVTALNLERYKDCKCLLISQLVVNLPPQLLPPLYDGLFDEISWATEDEHKNGDQKRKGSSSSEEAIIYLKPEDEIFHNVPLSPSFRTSLFFQSEF